MQQKIIYKYCLLCGRHLKTADSMARGYGDTCYKRVLKSKQENTLFKSLENAENRKST